MYQTDLVWKLFLSASNHLKHSPFRRSLRGGRSLKFAGKSVRILSIRHLTRNGFTDSFEIFTIYISYICVIAVQVSRLISQGKCVNRISLLELLSVD